MKGEEGLEDQTLQDQIDKKTFRKIGYSLFTMVVALMIAQIATLTALNLFAPGIEENPWYIVFLTGLPFYLVAFPIFLLMMRKIPNGPKGESKKMSFKDIIVTFFISMGATYIFNIVGNIINILISRIKGSDVINPLEMIDGVSNVIPVIIIAVILSPIIEEIVFRGVLLDKLRGYGDGTAICFSALTFALFHGNLSQFFYAFALGLIFGYIAIKTNTIRYTVILHILVNMFGIVIMPRLVLSGNIIFTMMAWLLIISFIIIGSILFISNYKKMKLEIAENEYDRDVRSRIIYWNIGMILYYIACLFSFVSVILA